VIVEAIQEGGLYKLVGVAQTLIVDCSTKLKKSNLNGIKDLNVTM
jgi:hypothetical protein